MYKLSYRLKKLSLYWVVALLPLFFIKMALANNTNLPQYSDYPAVVLCKTAKPLNLDFSENKQAAVFRTRLQAAAKQQPNFAGHYILTSWGCGAFCKTIAIIDAETGKVYMPVPNDSSWENYLVGWSYEKPQLDSKLLVINAQLTTAPRSNVNSLKGPFRYNEIYYKWENNQLVRIQ